MVYYFSPGTDGKCSEWTIVELQGDLETKSQATSLSGKFIGDLFFSHKVVISIKG